MWFRFRETKWAKKQNKKTMTMKKFIFLLALVPLVAGSCKNTLDTYNGQDRLSFVPRDEPDEVISFTFLFSDDDVTQDTIWLEVATMGFLTGQDRPVTLRQVDSEEPMAKPGVHFVPFDNADLQKHYVVKGGQNGALIPIVALRDPSMKDQTFTLDVELVANDAFLLGYDDRLVSHLTVSDMVAQPAEWDLNAAMNLLGDYGPVKYRLMIDAVKKNGYEFVPDGPWIASIMNAGDSALQDFWQAFFQAEVNAQNAIRAEQGLDPLAEADGKPVDFYTATRPF